MVGFNVFKLTCVLFLLGNIWGCQISPSIKQATTQDSKSVAVQQSTDAEQLYDLYEQANTAGDQVQALQYLTQAAKQGHLSAMVHLAEAYQDGRYGINDDAQALTLLNTAAEQGSVRAMTDLGITFFKGLGVSKDLVKAQDWFQRATTLGDMKAPVIWARFISRKASYRILQRLFNIISLLPIVAILLAHINWPLYMNRVLV